MKFNKTNFILALSLPVLAGVCLGLSEWFLQTGLLTVPLLFIYFEHLLIGWLFGFDLGRDAGGGFMLISFPLNIPVFAATAILDYLIVALILYFVLTYWIKPSNPKLY
jgi:hypothetical protein